MLSNERAYHIYSAEKHDLIEKKEQGK